MSRLEVEKCLRGCVRVMKVFLTNTEMRAMNELTLSILGGGRFSGGSPEPPIASLAQNPAWFAMMEDAAHPG